MNETRKEHPMKLQSLIDQKRREFAKKKKIMKRKAFFLKVKIFLTCVLPVVIILLAVKVVQTLVKTKVRKAAANVPAKKPEPVTPVPAAPAGDDENQI